MRVVSLVRAVNFRDIATGREYEAGLGHVFDFPEDLGRELTAKHASLWREQTAHEARVAAERLEELRNPHHIAPTLAELLDRVAALEAEVIALKAAQAEPGPPDGKSQTRARKTAAKPPAP